MKYGIIKIVDYVHIRISNGWILEISILEIPIDQSWMIYVLSTSRNVIAWDIIHQQELSCIDLFSIWIRDVKQLLW